MQKHKEILAAALEQLQLDDQHIQKKLLTYFNNLGKRASLIGLIGDSDPDRIMQRHILENLALVPQINRSLCLDMGTGAGLPGMVLALAMPHTKWLLLDGRKRCTDFLQEQIELLHLDNVTAVQCRAENHQPEQRHGLIISRALTTLKAYYRLAAPLIDDNGRILAIKGRNISQEQAELEAIEVTCEQMELPVPASQSTVLLVELSAKTTPDLQNQNHSGSMR